MSNVKYLSNPDGGFDLRVVEEVSGQHYVDIDWGAGYEDRTAITGEQAKSPSAACTAWMGETNIDDHDSSDRWLFLRHCLESCRFDS